MAAQERQQASAPYRSTGRSAPESDKDSGYSDVASECLSSVEQTDTEEAPPTSHRALKPPGAPPPPPPPLLILKNLLVDQGPDPHPHPWAARPPFQLLPSSPQILLFPPSAAPPKPQPPRGEKTTKYLPILNSYPKIAPHPPRDNKRGAESRLQSPSKKHQPGASHSSTGEEELLDKVLTCHEQTDSRDRAGGSEERAAPSLDDTHLSAPPELQNKSRRFQNTLDVLQRSGLLTIAIKTKELTRLNQATQTQLERLREEVSAYTRALTSNLPEDWQRLQELLANHRAAI